MNISFAVSVVFSIYQKYLVFFSQLFMFTFIVVRLLDTRIYKPLDCNAEVKKQGNMQKETITCSTVELR